MGQDNPEEGLSLQLHNSNFTRNPLPVPKYETIYRIPNPCFPFQAWADLIGFPKLT